MASNTTSNDEMTLAVAAVHFSPAIMTRARNMAAYRLGPPVEFVRAYHFQGRVVMVFRRVKIESPKPDKPIVSGKGRFERLRNWLIAPVLERIIVMGEQLKEIDQAIATVKQQVSGLRTRVDLIITALNNKPADQPVDLSREIADLNAISEDLAAFHKDDVPPEPAPAVAEAPAPVAEPAVNEAPAAAPEQTPTT